MTSGAVVPKKKKKRKNNNKRNITTKSPKIPKCGWWWFRRFRLGPSIFFSLWRVCVLLATKLMSSNRL